MSDYYMPDELLTKIITCLPAKSLVRFTCVCKSWYSLITNPDFITTHLNQSTLTNNNHLLLVRYCQKILDNERIFVHIIDSDTFDLCEKIEFPFQSSESNFRVYGSCKGLILLSNGILRKNTLMMLWNPSIRKTLTLPRLRYMNSKYDQIFGFGFDSRTNDYKVVRLVYLESMGNLSPKVELYKLSTWSWETITATFDPSCIVYENYLGDAFLNGAVHWGAYKMRCCTIMSFNMSDEEFSEIMLPPKLHFKIPFDIAICGEWLSLFHISNSMHGSVWAMKEYGVVESWTKLYTLDLRHGAALMTPLGFRKNGELLLRKLCGELFSYDSETQLIKYIGNSYACGPSCSGICIFQAYMDYYYVDSLVLFGVANRLGAGPAKQAKKKRKNRQDTVSL